MFSTFESEEQLQRGLQSFERRGRVQEQQLRREFAATRSDFWEQGRLGAGMPQEEVCSHRKRLSEAVMTEDWVCSPKKRLSGAWIFLDWVCSPKRRLSGAEIALDWVCSPRKRLSGAGTAQEGICSPWRRLSGAGTGMCFGVQTFSWILQDIALDPRTPFRSKMEPAKIDMRECTPASFRSLVSS